MEQNDVIDGQGVEPETNQNLEIQTDGQQIQEPSSMETLLEEQGLALDFPKKGEVRTGIIATITESEILVSVGTKSEGVISGREMEQIPDEERSEFELGSTIPVYVVTPEDSNGNVVLSYTRAREEKDWEEAERLLNEVEPFESNIIGYNKGGLLVPLGRLRGFVPASQISLLRRANLSGETPEQRWGNMVGEEISTSVIEVDRERRRLILSERAALQETRESLKERLLEELSEGDIRTGRVTSIADFGAFINIDGADGLVHLSEISWDRIQHPSEVLKVGQEVQVKVISIDRERRRIGLSIRRLQKDPWVKKVEHLREGQLIEGTITHLTKFGAFARLDEDLEGLIHISEISERRIDHPKEEVNEDDEVTLRIIRIDTERRRIGLSLRKVDSPAYSDLDWKMALAEEVEEVQETEEAELPVVDVIETSPEDKDESLEEVFPEPDAQAEPEAEDLPVLEDMPEIEAAVEEEAATEVEDTTETEVSSETEDLPESEAMTEVEAVVEVEAAPEDEDTTETEVSSETEELPESEAMTEVEAAVEEEVTTEVEDTTETEVSSETEDLPESEAMTEGEAAVEEEAAPEDEDTAETEVSSETEDLPEAEATPEVKAMAEEESDPEVVDTVDLEPKVEPESE